MIEANRHVIIQKVGGDHIRIVKVIPNDSYVIEKLRFSINEAVGKPYGMYEVNSKNLVRVCYNSQTPQFLQQQSTQSIPEIVIREYFNISKILNIQFFIR